MYWVLLMHTILSITAATIVVAAVTRHVTPTFCTLSTCCIVAFTHRRSVLTARRVWLNAFGMGAIMLVFWYSGRRFGWF